MPLKEIKKIGIKALEDVHNSNISTRLLNLIIDRSSCLLNRKSKANSTKNKKPNYNSITMKYMNRGMEKIGINSVLKEEEIVSSLPKSIKNKDPPVVTYQLTQPIRKHIFNYKETSEKFNSNTWKSNSYTCNCKNSKFIDTDHGHVVTGDLKIVKNNKLRNLLRKGPNYREPNSLNWTAVRTSIKTGLTEHIKKWSQKERK